MELICVKNTSSTSSFYFCIRPSASAFSGCLSIRFQQQPSAFDTLLLLSLSLAEHIQHPAFTLSPLPNAFDDCFRIRIWPSIFDRPHSTISAFDHPHSTIVRPHLTVHPHLTVCAFDYPHSTVCIQLSAFDHPHSFATVQLQSSTLVFFSLTHQGTRKVWPHQTKLAQSSQEYIHLL